MTTVQFILIIIAVVIMMIGLYMIIRGFTQQKTNKHAQGINRDKNGIPIIPRHEREIFDAEEDTDDERTEDLEAGETVIKPDRDHLEAVIEEDQFSESTHNDDRLNESQYLNDRHYEQNSHTAFDNDSSEPNSLKHRSLEQYSDEAQTTASKDYRSNLIDGRNEYSHDYDTQKDSAALQESSNESSNRLEKQNHFNHGLDPQGKQVNQSQYESELNNTIPTATGSQALGAQASNSKVAATEDAHLKALQGDEPEDDLFSNLVSATETIMPVIETAEEPEFVDNSPMLDQHLLAEADQDQNSPLNHAEENINITLVPRNEYEKIDGRKILSLVSQYGLKYGAMNMFHRYEHKDGSGILWFSMMGVTEEGIAPFDLNILPNSRYHGLVLFLSLPHPKATQGFDSMMSVVNLISNDLNMLVLDENNEILTRDRRQQLRNQVQEYQSSSY